MASMTNDIQTHSKLCMSKAIEASAQAHNYFLEACKISEKVEHYVNMASYATSRMKQDPVHVNLYRSQAAQANKLATYYKEQEKECRITADMLKGQAKELFMTSMLLSTHSEEYQDVDETVQAKQRCIVPSNGDSITTVFTASLKLPEKNSDFISPHNDCISINKHYQDPQNPYEVVNGTMLKNEIE